MNFNEALITNNLHKLLIARGYSLQEFAHMCGLSKNHIWQLGKSLANPTLRTAYIISKVLGVELEEIWPNTVEVVEETITVRRVVCKDCGVEQELTDIRF